MPNWRPHVTHQNISRQTPNRSTDLEFERSRDLEVYTFGGLEGCRWSTGLQKSTGLEVQESEIIWRSRGRALEAPTGLEIKKGEVNRSKML